ncbi:MAG: orotidine-5'-phosphate decarboxylase [Acidimicrobiales bacterium]|nr:orotidine-5'-phosphate decarboxylase [Acidimicrobiales bacterium]
MSGAPPAPVAGPLAGAPVRERLAVALDTPDLDRAVRLARSVRARIGVAKVGLELYCAAGPAVVSTLAEEGFAVFVDLKLHDIPTTVGRAARVLGRLACSYVNFHAAGGPAMLRAGVEGLAEGAAAAGLASPVALAVTVLTSEDAPEDLLRARVHTARSAGCGGVVCAAADLAVVRQRGPGLLTAVPGIRPLGTLAHDQVRVATPAAAMAAGADLLVVGRPLTEASDPVAAADALWAEVAGAQGGDSASPERTGCDQPV